MPPINLLNYHLLGDGKPHSRETRNREPFRAKVKTAVISEIIKNR